MAADDHTGDEFVAWLRERVAEQGYSLDGRSRRGTGQSQLASASGVLQSVISRTLAGRGRPSVETLLGLARALHIDPTVMLERAGYDEFAQQLRDIVRSHGTQSSAPVLRDSVLAQIESSGLPEPVRLELAAQYRRRLAQIEQDIAEMVELMRRGERVKSEREAGPHSA